MYMEHARHKDKGKGFEITQERERASYRSGVNLLFMASLNVFRTEQYLLKKTDPWGFPFFPILGGCAAKGYLF